MSMRCWLSCVAISVSSCAPRAASVETTALPRVVRSSTGIEMVELPDGVLVREHAEGLSPARILIRRFFLARTETTQEQFARFVEATGYVTTAEQAGGAKVWTGTSWEMRADASFRNVFPGPNRPVVAVSWYDAARFTAWLTEVERDAGLLASGEIYRLPTEDEWEYAARAGTRDAYAGADSSETVCEIANVPDQSAQRGGLGREIFPCDDGFGIGTAPVASRRANRWGFFDLSGNVWEWTLTAEGDEYVMRGGSWSGRLTGARVGARDRYPPELRGGAIGFRVARGAPP